MFQFLTFTHQPGYVEGGEPELPGLGQLTCHEAYARMLAGLKGMFRTRLLEWDGDFRMAIDAPGMGRFSLGVQTFDQTAALVHVGLRGAEREVVELPGLEGRPVEVEQYLGSWILLGGLKAGDDRLLAFLRQRMEGVDPAEAWKRAGTEDEFLLPPVMVDMLSTLPRPVVMQRMQPELYEVTSSDGAQAKLYWFLIACEAFGQAFFDQFALSRANELET